MRLPSIPLNEVTAEQRSLFDKLNTGIKEHLHGFTTHKPDGSLIGPFSALLLFPAYGTPVWELFLALGGNSVLPKAVREVVILATAARFGALYELYSHEAVAAVLNRGHQVPNSTYDAAVSAFGIQGVAEIAYFVGCYGLISSLLSTFDVNLPGIELG
jgi:4-carboxymuconolactone decarboxylase